MLEHHLPKRDGIQRNGSSRRGHWKPNLRARHRLCHRCFRRSRGRPRRLSVCWLAPPISMIVPPIIPLSLRLLPLLPPVIPHLLRLLLLLLQLVALPLSLRLLRVPVVALPQSLLLLLVPVIARLPIPVSLL